MPNPQEYLMPKRRVSTSFSDRQVNVLAAMMDAAMTGVFVNPEDTTVFQEVAIKVTNLKARVK